MEGDSCGRHNFRDLRGTEEFTGPCHTLQERAPTCLLDDRSVHLEKTVAARSLRYFIRLRPCMKLNSWIQYPTGLAASATELVEH